MTSKTLICAEVEYDRAVTDPDRIVRQLNANRRQLGGAELPPFVPLTAGLSLEIQDQSGGASDESADFAVIQILRPSVVELTLRAHRSASAPT